ncbi:EF-hand domain-containing protein [Robiginitomaculum antarcticum]|uniref:hypothetical protein n=1 Tax=Robiginitomaculum antarcticum TaxID=437507 RepID=UPI000364B5B9|nr:hypothetical protein [Robiginitomaculum antarcticum]
MHIISNIACLLPPVILLCACQTLRGAAPVHGASDLAARMGSNVAELGAVVTRPIGALASKGDMAYMDKNGDMRLSIEEFSNAMTPPAAYRLEAAMLNLTVDRYVRADFYLTDINQDGFIDRAELTAMRRRDAQDRRAAFLNAPL